MQQDLSVFFNMFAGHEIEVTETEVVRHQGTSKERKILRPDLKVSDPVFQALTVEAEKQALHLRTFLSAKEAGTMDTDGHRLNVFLEQDADKKYRVKNFTIG
jgi:hypothetical protein